MVTDGCNCSACFARKAGKSLSISVQSTVASMAASVSSRSFWIACSLTRSSAMVLVERRLTDFSPFLAFPYACLRAMGSISISILKRLRNCSSFSSWFSSMAIMLPLVSKVRSLKSPSSLLSSSSFAYPVGSSRRGSTTPIFCKRFPSSLLLALSASVVSPSPKAQRKWLSHGRRTCSPSASLPRINPRVGQSGNFCVRMPRL